MAYTPSYTVVIPNADVYTPSYAVNFNDEEDVQGQGAITMPAIIAVGVGRLPVVGTGSATLPPILAIGIGRIPPQGKGSANLPAITASGTGFIPPQGSGNANLPAIIASGTGNLPPQGMGAATLPAIIALGTGEIPPQGRGNVTMPAIIASGTGETRESIRINGGFLAFGGNATVLEDLPTTINGDFLTFGGNLDTGAVINANFLVFGGNANVLDSDTAQINGGFLLFDGNASGTDEAQPVQINANFLTFGGNIETAATIGAKSPVFGGNAKATDIDSVKFNTSFLVFGGNIAASDQSPAKINAPFLEFGADIQTAATINAPFLQFGGFASVIDLDSLGAEVRNSVAYSMNINTEESTRFSNFPFDHIIANGDKYYGVMPDGLYEIAFDIETDYDKAAPLVPKEIVGSVVTKDSDHGRYQSKYLQYVYCNSDRPGKLKVTPFYDGIEKLPHESKYGDRKVHMSRKPSSRYMQLKIEKIRLLEGVELITSDRQRRVR